METAIEFKAIGTSWWITIYDNLTNEQKMLVEAQVLNLTSEFENLYSRFLEDSLVSKINRGEIIDNPPEDLSNMLNLSETVRVISDGHFDINIGKTLENLGYDSKYSFKESLNSNSRIDLGGIGKGYLIDKVKNLLIQNKVEYFFINAGGDIFATSNFNKPIEFLLENPFNKTQTIGKISISNQSIAASSPSLRKWQTTNTNKKVHHLIDFKSGESVDDIAGVFTIANNAVNADLASTAIFVSPQHLHSKIAEGLKCEYLIIFSDSSFKNSQNYPALLN